MSIAQANILLVLQNPKLMEPMEQAAHLRPNLQYPFIDTKSRDGDDIQEDPRRQRTGVESGPRACQTVALIALDLILHQARLILTLIAFWGMPIA
jgi:hypothetical protein